MELRSFEKLFQMAKIINSRFEISEILQVLVEAIASEITQADLVGFFLKQPDGTFRGYTGNKLPVDITQLIIDPGKDKFVMDIVNSRAMDYIPNTNNDLRADPEKIKLLKIQSLLGIPVTVEDDIYGLVFIHDFGKPMNLTEEQIEVTEAFVNMASVVIRNIQMFQKTKHLLERQKLLLDTTNALSKSLSTHEVLKTCFHFMQKASGAEDIGIHLYNEKERTLTPYHISSIHVAESEWRGKHANEINLNIDSDRLFYEVVTEQKAIAIPDVFSDPRPNYQACKTFGIQSLLLIPLVANGKVFGVVAIPSIQTTRSYTDYEIEFCQSISDMSAAALSNTIHAENLDNIVKQRTIELQQANFKLEGLVKELEFLNELKNDFIASLSHELRTPITAVKGSNDILHRCILGDLNAEQKDLLEISNKAISRLLNQVNELLDFAKLENGKFELSFSEVAFDEVLDSALRIVEPLLDKKKQKIIVKENLKISLPMDRQRIEQIILNLLSNANKFTPKNGTITVNSYLNEQALEVEVRDDGIGIPADKQKYIFTKFYQANNQMNGTGLGLAISKQLIELHGGRIWFESTEGQGSIFRFTLPLERTLRE